ncbi:MAG: radical SAM protein [Bacteroidota bacterium]
MMKAIQLSNLCCNLIKRDLLKNRLAITKLPAEKLTKFLYELYYTGLRNYTDLSNDKNIEKLEELGFIKIIEIEDHQFESKAEAQKNEYLHIPIAHLEALNLELTYECNSNCPNCFLKIIRKSFKGKELSYTKIKSIIADAYFAGLLENGINFTGGETLLANVDIFDLIRYASSYGIPTRLFTNTFWGSKMFFKVGNQRFSTSFALIKLLKKSGLNQLAINFDSRLDKDISGIKQLTATIEACETLGLNYELVSSKEGKVLLDLFIHDLLLTLNVKALKFMTPITIDLIDMGGAKDAPLQNIHQLSIKELISNSMCKGKGFYQPTMLTIDPNGGVRSCMYGLGMCNLGNINENSLFEIINDFKDEVSECFASKKAFELADLLYEPHKDIYKAFSHPCSACILLARLIQEYYSLAKTQTVSTDDILAININVAKDLNFDYCLTDDQQMSNH